MICNPVNQRVILAFLALSLASCSSSETSRYATEDEGPLSVRARNNLAAENPDGLVRVAQGFERAGNISGAFRLYGQAMAAEPALVSAQLGYARTSIKLGRATQGQKMLETLLQENPDDPQVRLSVADVRIDAGEFQSAKELIAPMARLSDANAEVLDLYGRLHHVTGNLGAARDAFDRAMKAAPQGGAGLVSLALSFGLDGEYQSAVALLQRAMDHPQTQLEAQQGLAIVYALSGQNKAARVIAMKAMTPEEMNKLDFLMTLFPKMSDQERAAAVLFNRVPINLVQSTTEP